MPRILNHQKTGDPVYIQGITTVTLSEAFIDRFTVANLSHIYASASQLTIFFQCKPMVRTESYFLALEKPSLESNLSLQIQSFIEHRMLYYADVFSFEILVKSS